jgi:hypothetical protein
MKRLLTLMLLLLVASNVMATDRMGISTMTDAENSLIVASPYEIFEFYLCIFEPSAASVHGFECGLELTNPDMIILFNQSFPVDAINFGTIYNNMVGFTEPVPSQPITVISTIEGMVLGAPYESLILMGPSDPSSFFDEGPGYANGENIDDLILCTVPDDGVVGTITTNVVATEPRSLSAVKALFD